MKNYFGCTPRGVGVRRKYNGCTPPRGRVNPPPPQPTSPGGINPLLKIPPVKNHPPPPLPGGGGGTGIELMLTPPRNSPYWGDLPRPGCPQLQTDDPDWHGNGYRQNTDKWLIAQQTTEIWRFNLPEKPKSIFIV